MALIEREALRQDLLKRGFYPVIVKHALEEAPAVDAVPVVRCKDCDFRRRSGRCSKSGLYTLDNDFCSYGERKDNE